MLNNNLNVLLFKITTNFSKFLIFKIGISKRNSLKLNCRNLYIHRWIILILFNLYIFQN